MKKKILFILFITSFYYIFTFSLSFINISNTIGVNNYKILGTYINKKNLKKNLEKDFFLMKDYIIKDINSNIYIEEDSFTFSGQLTTSFYNKFFFKMADNISNDLSESEIILYFYYNSNNLYKYFDQYLLNFGEYSFERFIQNLSIDKNNKIKNTIEQNVNKLSNKINLKDKRNSNIKDQIKTIIKKYLQTDYFFLISPIHFKLQVDHQDMPFSIIFKFNGYRWKINDIKIPFHFFYKDKIK